MKIEHAKVLISLLQAYAEGKTIEMYSTYYEHWNDVTSKEMDSIVYFVQNGRQLRIKKEIEYMKVQT